MWKKIICLMLFCFSSVSMAGVTGTSTPPGYENKKSESSSNQNDDLDRDQNNQNLDTSQEG